jgi:hypothetical protein
MVERGTLLRLDRAAYVLGAVIVMGKGTSEADPGNNERVRGRATQQ